MEIEYKKSESTEKPISIEAQPKNIILRKNIQEEIRSSDDGTKVKYYVYDEAILTYEAFNAYSTLMNSINTTDLVDGQTLSGDNQMTIMEAITDIYDLIASK